MGKEESISRAETTLGDFSHPQEETGLYLSYRAWNKSDYCAGREAEHSSEQLDAQDR